MMLQARNLQMNARLADRSGLTPSPPERRPIGTRIAVLILSRAADI